MKLRPFFTVLLAIVFVLISASVVGAVWLSTQNPLRLSDTRISSRPEASVFVSRQAPLMLSLQVNPDRLKAYRLTNTPIGQRTQIQAQFDRWQRRLLGEPRLSYADDIAPWAADEMTLALMNPDVDRDFENGLQPGYLLAVEIADPTQANASLQRFWRGQASTRNQVKERFAGVELTYADEASRRRSTDTAVESPSLATAIVSDRFVLFANYPKVLRQALNNVQVAELSLNADRTYQQAIDQLTDRRIGVAFVNLPQFATWLTAQRPEPTETCLIAALQPTSEGMLAKLSLLSAASSSADPSRSLPKRLLNSLTEANSPSSNLAEAKEILKNLPANSVFVLTGVDVGQTWQQFQESGTSWANYARTAIDRLQQEWGVDFAADLFPWMPGEFALALVPRSGSGDERADRGTSLLQQFDAAFIVAQSPDTEAGLNYLNAIAAKQGVSTGTFQLSEQNVFAWTKLTPLQARNRLSLEATVQGLRSQIGDYQVFATSVEAMRQVTEASTAETPASLQKAIAHLNDFQEDIASGVGRYQVYLDWGEFRSRFGDQSVVRRLEQTVKPLFESLRTVAFTESAAERAARSSNGDSRSSRSLGTLLLKFQDSDSIP